MAHRSTIASFRDPSGRVLVLKDRVIRVVYSAGRADLEAFLASTTIQRAQDEGRAVTTRRLDHEEIERLEPELTAAGVQPDQEDEPLVVEHNRIPFVSYPHEWPPEMLDAAAELTLELQQGLLQEGLSLKDATPNNVLFHGPRPVFVDALSAEARDPHDPFWRPHGQFTRTFLLPLLAARHHGLPLSASLIWQGDGLEPETLYRMTPPLRRWRSPHRWLVTLPTRLNARAKRQGEDLYKTQHKKNPDMAKYVVAASVRSLGKRLKQVRPETATRSHWSGYMDARDHYPDADAQSKDAFIERILQETGPGWVLDVGCNTGHFSAMAAEKGAHVVAVDQDPVSVGRVWRRATQEDLDILPLVVDIARPTPAVGWMNQECASFLERAEKRFDMVFMLAVMHHLHVTQRLPVAEIVRLLARLTRRHAVIEYVGPQDPMFRQLLRGRDHLHTELTRALFEEALEAQFDVLARQPLEGTDRSLYLLRRQEVPTDESEPVAVSPPARSATGGER